MEQELIEFLVNTDCKDCILKMEEEKLSMTVINQMAECDLAPFIPRIGDRVSLKLFEEEDLKKKKKAKEGSTGKKRSSLGRSLREKLGIFKDTGIKRHNDSPSSSDDSDIVPPKLKRHNEKYGKQRQ